MVLILPTFLLANAFARILVKSQHERMRTKPKRNRLCLRAELVFSQPLLPSLPIRLSLTRESPVAGSSPQAAADEATPNGRMPGRVLGLLSQRGPLADAPSVGHTMKDGAAPERWGGQGAARRAGTGRGSRGSLQRRHRRAPPAPQPPGRGRGGGPCPLPRRVFALKILNVRR